MKTPPFPFSVKETLASGTRGFHNRSITHTHFSYSLKATENHNPVFFRLVRCLNVLTTLKILKHVKMVIEENTTQERVKVYESGDVVSLLIW